MAEEVAEAEVNNTRLEAAIAQAEAKQQEAAILLDRHRDRQVELDTRAAKIEKSERLLDARTKDLARVETEARRKKAEFESSLASAEHVRASMEETQQEIAAEKQKVDALTAALAEKILAVDKVADALSARERQIADRESVVNSRLKKAEDLEWRNQRKELEHQRVEVETNRLKNEALTALIGAKAKNEEAEPLRQKAAIHMTTCIDSLVTVIDAMLMGEVELFQSSPKLFGLAEHVIGEREHEISEAAPNVVSAFPMLERVIWPIRKIATETLKRHIASLEQSKKNKREIRKEGGNGL